MLEQLLTLKNVCKTKPVYLKCKDDNSVYRMFGFAVGANQVLVQRAFLNKNGELMFLLCTRSPDEIECQTEAPVTMQETIESPITYVMPCDTPESVTQALMDHFGENRLSIDDDATMDGEFVLLIHTINIEESVFMAELGKHCMTCNVWKVIR